MGKSLRTFCTSYAGTVWTRCGIFATVLIPLLPNSAPRLLRIARRNIWQPLEVLPQPASPDDRAAVANSCGPGTHWQTPAVRGGAPLLQPGRENAGRKARCHQTGRSL